MFHKAISVKFLENAILELTFQTGDVKSFDVSTLFDKYPQMRALSDSGLFCSGVLEGPYGIRWTDDLDLDAETVFEDGIPVRKDIISANFKAANAVTESREKVGISQLELADRTGIDQSDISKIERGKANPSLKTLERLATAMGKELEIKFV